MSEWTERVYVLATERLTSMQKSMVLWLLRNYCQAKPSSWEDALNSTKLVAFTYNLEGKIAGVATLKDPPHSRRENLAQKSGVGIPTDANYGVLEIGYVAVRPSLRNNGVASAVVEKILEHASGPVYGTVIDGSEMEAVAQDAGFERIGSSWPSEVDNGETVSMYVRNTANRTVVLYPATLVDEETEETPEDDEELVADQAY